VCFCHHTMFGGYALQQRQNCITHNHDRKSESKTLLPPVPHVTRRLHAASSTYSLAHTGHSHHSYRRHRTSRRHRRRRHRRIRYLLITHNAVAADAAVAAVAVVAAVVAPAVNAAASAAGSSLTTTWPRSSALSA